MTPFFFVMLLLLATLTSTALCGPLGKRKDDPPYTETKGISQALFDDLQLMVQYCAATYYPSNVNSTGDKLSCSRDHCEALPIDNCPRVEEANASTANEFTNTDDGDDDGYLAIDNSNNLIVLAFRGADSWENWVNNVDISHIQSDFCDGCEVHEGFWYQYIAMRDDYIYRLTKAHEQYPQYRMIITGHSLGGALATLAAADIRRLEGPWYMANVELYTYGSPRIGNEATARFLSEQSSHSYRVTSMHDVVPRMPPVHDHYWHMQPEYWIRKNPDNPRPKDITVLTGYNNKKGDRDSHSLKGEPHRHYFGLIRGCD